MIDLHMHTTASDGIYTPKELILRAKEIGLFAISITDHDTVKAYNEQDLFNFAREQGVKLISGIEISTRDEDGNKYHILGYNLNISDNSLLELLSKIETSRTGYTRLVIDRLQTLGFYIQEKELEVDGGTITKAHIARSVVKDHGNQTRLASELGQDFTEGSFIETYLLPGQEAFIKPGFACSTELAVQTIHNAGGVAIVAHPTFNIIKGQDFEDMCSRLESLGIDGYEAINIQFDKSRGDREVDMVQEFSQRARDKDMIVTGGSDYHGSVSLMGNMVELGMVNTKYHVRNDVIEQLEAGALKYKTN